MHTSGMDGGPVGWDVGGVLGLKLDTEVGRGEGSWDAPTVGTKVGANEVGALLGDSVGTEEGTWVGCVLGTSVGAVVGVVVGYWVGDPVGADVGDSVVGAALGSVLPRVGACVLGLADGVLVGLDVVGLRVLDPRVGVAVGW